MTSIYDLINFTFSRKNTGENNNLFFKCSKKTLVWIFTGYIAKYLDADPDQCYIIGGSATLLDTQFDCPTKLPEVDEAQSAETRHVEHVHLHFLHVRGRHLLAESSTAIFDNSGRGFSTLRGRLAGFGLIRLLITQSKG